MNYVNEWAYCIFHPNSYRARTTHLRIKRSTERAILWGMNIIIALILVAIGWQLNVINTRLEQRRLIKQYYQQLQIQEMDSHVI